MSTDTYAARAYLNDRQRVELMLPCKIAFVLADLIERQDDADREALAPILRNFAAAINEPLRDLTDADRAKVARRVHRVLTDLMVRYEGKTIAIPLLTLHRFLSVLIDKGLMELHAGTPFADAWDALTEALVSRDENVASLEAEANRRQAGADCVLWLKELNAQGYYRGALTARAA